MRKSVAQVKAELRGIEDEIQKRESSLAVADVVVNFNEARELDMLRAARIALRWSLGLSENPAANISI